MDPFVPTPRKIAPKNQVSIPEADLAAIGARVGDTVYVMPNPDRQGTLVLVPRALMADVIRKGWTAI